MSSPLTRSTPLPARRILVVDADHRVRDSLAGLIALADGVEVVGAASEAAEAIAAVRRTHPDIVVIDPRLPELEAGLALIPAMHRVQPAALVLVMGWSQSLEPAALAVGAGGFICKTDDPVGVVEAVLGAAHAARDARPGRISAPPGGSVAPRRAALR